MPEIRIDDLDAPVQDRTLSSRLARLLPDYQIQITLREAQWLPHAVEEIRVYLTDHPGLTASVLTYLGKTIADVFKEWATDRLKRATNSTEKLTIYGPDNKPFKSIMFNRDSIDE
jgi:hypothetical protein